MRSLFMLLAGSVLFISGCCAPPEYGTILQELPRLEAAEAPFPFPMEGDNDHQNCVFNEEDFF